MWGATNTGTGAKFADQVKLDDHFNRHGSDFGATPAADYAQKVDNFLTGPKSPIALEIVRTDGDVVRYDPATEAFGVVSICGTVRTFYKPDPTRNEMSNLDYFNSLDW